MTQSDAHAAAAVPSVFISHTTRDRRDLDLAHRIAGALTERGARVWIAPESIPIGDEWQPHLVAAVLEECTHFLVILSAASIQAEWVTQEIALARERHASGRPLKVLSIRVGTLQDFPESDFLAQFQQVPYESDPDAQARLVAGALGLGYATPAPVQAYLAAVREYCARSSYLTLRELRAIGPRGETYVPLQVEFESAGEADAGRMPDTRTRMSDAEMISAEPRGHILLVGEPGTGKSTLLRRLAERCWDAPETIGLERRHLPLIAPLRRLSGAEGTISERLGAALTSELALAEPLPTRFFEEWTRQTVAPWLILLDAFDEVPATERPRLAEWLDSALHFLGDHRLVVTVRAASAGPDPWEQQFARYRLLPFTHEQATAFAQNWFGAAAAGFIRELERLRAGGPGGTVLLLTIAARVYLKKGQLPEARARLYRECVEIWLEEARLLGLDQELGAELGGPANLQGARLAHLALRLTEHRDASTLDQLSEFIAEYLISEEGIPRGRAHAWSTHFIGIMARRSGILVRRGDAYEMVHATFREFLTASAIATAYPPGSLEADGYVDRWTRFDWFEVVLFLFASWGEAGHDISKPLERVLESEQGLEMAGATLADGVRVAAVLEERIIDGLLAEARLRWFGRHDRFNAFRILARLAGRPKVTAGLQELAHDGTLDEEKRLSALGALRNLGNVEETDILLAELASAQPAAFWDSDRAGYFLRRVGDAGLLQTLAENGRVDKGIRLHAAIKRVEWAWDYGPPDDAVSVILELAAAPEPDPAVRLEALNGIEKLRPKEDLIPALRSVASDTKARTSTRMLAARRLRDAGKVEEGESVLLAVALDRFTPPGLRQQAAVDLSLHWWPDDMTPSDASRLLGYAADKRLPRVTRVLAGDRALRALGGSDALEDLLALARDRSQGADLRAAAIFSLGFRANDPLVSEIASTLEALARDPGEEASGIALESLATLAYRDRARVLVAEQLRERDLAPLAVLIEQIAAVLGDEQALGLMSRVVPLLEEAPPLEGAASEAMAEFVRRRRDATNEAFQILLLGPHPAHAPIFLSLATSLAIEPEVRTIARACAFAAVAGGKLTAELVTMLRDPATDPRAREVVAWFLRHEAVETVAAELETVAQDVAVPSHVRLAAIESLVVLGHSEQAADLLVLAGGGTLPRPRLEPWPFYEISTEREHRFLAQVAWDSGFPDLSPILVHVAASLGVAGARRVLLSLATGSDPGSA